jgi:hypothetical protein
MKHRHLTIALLTITALSTITAIAVDPKYQPIADAMDFAHKAPKGEKKVCEKIVGGIASDDELKKTLELYKGMVNVEPPKGDPADFKSRVEKLVAATQEVVDKKPDGVAHYKEAVNCKACHTEHKPD